MQLLKKCLTLREDRLVQQVRQVHKANRVPPDLLDRTDLLVIKAQTATLVEILVPLAQPAPEVRQDPSGHKDLLDRKETKVPMAYKES